MPVIDALGSPPPASAIAAAMAELAAGHIVALPTDTVYGLAVGADRPEAMALVYEAKRRPDDLRLPVLVAGIEQATTVVHASEAGLVLMRRFWPGALTIVLPARPGAAAAGGHPTVGVRSPDAPVAAALCAAAGPLAVTSANHHGADPPATAADVADLFGEEVALVLDGGPCTGTPSTVVDATGPVLRLLREGGVPWKDVLAAAGG